MCEMIEATKVCLQDQYVLRSKFKTKSKIIILIIVEILKLNDVYKLWLNAFILKIV